MDHEKPLDDIGKSNKSDFGKWSFRFLLISVCSLLLFTFVTLDDSDSYIWGIISLFFFLSFALFNIIGFVVSIISIIRKEPDTIYKTIGVTGNILLLFLLIAIMVFAMMDFIKSK